MGQNRLPLRSSDFKIKLILKEEIPAKIVLKNDSLQWIRTEEVLLVPRGRVALYLKGDAADFHVRYKGQSILTQQEGSFAHTEFFISLFEKEKIEIFKNGSLLGHGELLAKTKKGKRTHLIDYSCSRNNIQIKGMEGEFLSLGCRVQRVGAFGEEKPMMEVLWTSANYRLLDDSKAPYIAVFMDNNPVKLKVANRQNEIKEIEIKASVPKRMRRLNTAIGFGPYVFETTFKPSPTAPQEDKSVPMAPALMFYANFKLTQGASVRGFNAAVWQESVFNNAGIYFANDVAEIFDKKLIITTLLGMQSLYFRFDENENIVNEAIFPQGIEFLYKHAFDIENYIVSGGLFVSPSESVDYQNLWIRWGKNYFWELNYIYWGKEKLSAKMWGLSIGLPLKSFF
ncbi:MAG: hypothetical protein WEB87_03445 [Bacteriovoracaceae bacterium]